MQDDNILFYCRFDKRITEFAERKFHRDGIDVKLGSMVVKVAENEICTKERGTGKVVSLPYGMVVWSTGIGPRPEVVQFMKDIGQVCFHIFLPVQSVELESLCTKFAYLVSISACSDRVIGVQ